MADGIRVAPSTNGSDPIVATRTLTVNGTTSIEVAYSLLGYESSGLYVPCDLTHGFPTDTVDRTGRLLGHVTVDAMPSLPAGSALIGHVVVDSTGGTTAVSAAALPLPAGAATEASLGTDGATPPTIPGTGVRGWLRSIYDTLRGTIAVTGTFWQATQPVSAASLPLPAGAATGALQGTGNTSLASIDGKVTTCDTAHVTVTGALPAGSALIGHVVADSVGGTVAISAASLPLPTGAATDATLATLSGKFGALGQHAMAGSTSVAIASDQSGVPVTGTFWQATQPVSLASLPALPAGTNTIGNVVAEQAGDVIVIAGVAYTVKRAPILDATASGATQVVAAVASKKIRVIAYALGPVSGAVNVYFKSAAAGQISGTKCLAANGGMGRGLNQFGHFETTAGEALQINLSAAVTCGVEVLYIEV